jgi:Protein of unknown function (DUF4232)
VSVPAEISKQGRHTTKATTVPNVPRPHPSPRVWLAALSVVFVLTGCAPTGGVGAQADASRSPASTGVTTGARAQQTPSETPSAPSPSKSRSTAKTALPPARCRASALDASAAVARGLGRRPEDDQWQFATDFTLTNISRSTCVLDGWVGVTLRGTTTKEVCYPGATCVHPDQQRIHPAPATDVRGATLVTLRPKASTRFSVLWVGLSCLDAPHRVDFEVPHDHHVLSVLKPSLCSGPIIVTPIGQVAHKVDDGA